MTPSAETDKDKVVGVLANLIAMNSMNSVNPLIEKLCLNLNINPEIPKKVATSSGSGDLDGKEKAIVCLEFSVGVFKRRPKKYQKTERNKKKKNMEKLETVSGRVPAVLERRGCSSFCVTVEEDKGQQVGENIPEGYRAVDHVILDIAESMGKGKHEKVHSAASLFCFFFIELVLSQYKLCVGLFVFMSQNEDLGKVWSLLCSQATNQAVNQQPVLSGLTTFNKISVTESLDPLNGSVQDDNFFL